MRKQQQIWHDEHIKQATLPGMADTEPAGAVIYFVDFLKKLGIKSGRAIDVGAGKGRNSIYIAQQGFEVYALEYIKVAIDTAKELATTKGVSDNVRFKLIEIDKPWDFPDNYFDIAIDSYSSIDIETKEGRETYRNEMHRTLKPDGYALVTVCSADDEWEAELIDKYPGPEPNSSLWPQNGKFQKDYDTAELNEFYKSFKIIELKKISKPAFKMGRNGIATNLRLIIKK